MNNFIINLLLDYNALICSLHVLFVNYMKVCGGVCVLLFTEPGIRILAVL